MSTVAILHATVIAATCCMTALVADHVAEHGVSGLLTGPLATKLATATLAVSYAGILLEMFSVLRTIRADIRLRLEVRTAAVPSPRHLQDVSRRAGLAGRVVLVANDQPFALTYGLRRPRVAVSTGLTEQLDVHELEAVLTHELTHVHGRDPMRRILVDSLSRRYFFLPLVKQLARMFMDGRELVADRWATQKCGRSAVAGALLKVVEGPAWAPAASAAGMGSKRLLSVRIDQLETGAATLRARQSVLGLATTTLSFALLLSMVAVAWSYQDGSQTWCCILSDL